LFFGYGQVELSGVVIGVVRKHFQFIQDSPPGWQLRRQ
jgi:hypothetical protein